MEALNQSTKDANSQNRSLNSSTHRFEVIDLEEISEKLMIKTDDYISWSECAKQCIFNSIPVILGLFFETSVEIINLVFIGRLNDPISFAGIGLGTLLMNFVAISFITGICGGLDTLVSQAYGAKRFIECGVYLNSCRLVLLVLFIPQSIILWNSGFILTIIGQNQQIAYAAQSYVRHLFPGIICFGMFETTRRFLNAQLKFLEPSIAQLVALCFHFFWCYIFINIFELGIVGAAIATCITYTLDCVLLNLFVTFKSGYVKKESWHWLNTVVICCLECWCIEMLSIMSGWLSENELAANVSLLNLNYIVYNFPLGMSYAVCAMIGNSLGSNSPKKAIRYVKTSLCLSFIFCILTIIILLVFREPLSCIFTQESHIVEIMNQLILVYALIVICDYMQGVMGGIIRGMGYQRFASLIISVSYWVVAIPIAYSLAYLAHLRIIGVWLGLPTGSLVICACFTLTLIKTDWVLLARKSEIRCENY